MKARFYYSGGNTEDFDVEATNKNGITIARLAKEQVGRNVKYIDFLYDYFNVKAGSDGYYVTNFAADGTYLTEFTERENLSASKDHSFVACYGMNKGKTGVLAIVTGMRYDFGMEIGVKDGVYYLYPRFYIDCDEMYEDICVELYNLDDGSYSAMARKYRQYQLTRGGCVPLKERAANDKRLMKATEGIEVRIRQGWKPAPSPVEYQTPENEPSMYAACSFDRVGDIADEFKVQGIDKAEFCLVGWNSGGHDGRFPQLLPVEPKLGGKEKMLKLIEKLHSMGYGIVCHDDATAAYTIADCFDEEYLLKNKDMTFHKRPYCWSGGRPHKICPRRQYERFELSNQELIKSFGFEGVHYIDVITILPLLKCYDKSHPLNRRDSAEWYRKIMRLARKNFGGFASESGYDFAAAETDYVMYPVYKTEPDENTPLCDKYIPFWHIVYHGIIMYNPCTFSLNYTAKKPDNRLKYFEWGGRPLVCYYANFATGNNWMGMEDFLADTDEQLKDSVKKIKQMAEDYEALRPERFEFIENHEEVSSGVFRTEYSNGTVVTVNYNDKTYKIERV